MTQVAPDPMSEAIELRKRHDQFVREGHASADIIPVITAGASPEAIQLAFPAPATVPPLPDTPPVEGPLVGPALVGGQPFVGPPQVKDAAYWAARGIGGSMTTTAPPEIPTPRGTFREYVAAQRQRQQGVPAGNPSYASTPTTADAMLAKSGLAPGTPEYEALAAKIGGTPSIQPSPMALAAAGKPAQAPLTPPTYEEKFAAARPAADALAAAGNYSGAISAILSTQYLDPGRLAQPSVKFEYNRLVASAGNYLASPAALAPLYDKAVAFVKFNATKAPIAQSPDEVRQQQVARADTLQQHRDQQKHDQEVAQADEKQRVEMKKADVEFTKERRDTARESMDRLQKQLDENEVQLAQAVAQQGQITPEGDKDGSLGKAAAKTTAAFAARVDTIKARLAPAKKEYGDALQAHLETMRRVTAPDAQGATTGQTTPPPAAPHTVNGEVPARGPITPQRATEIMRALYGPGFGSPTPEMKAKARAQAKAEGYTVAEGG